MLMDSLLLFLTHLVAMGALAVAVLAASVPNKVKLPLASTIISLLAWQDTVYVSNRATSLVHVWDQLSFVWPTVAVISFFLFMYQLSEYRRWRIINQTVLKQYLPIIMVSVGTILQSIAIAGGRIYSSSGQIVERGWGYGVYIVGIGLALLGLVFFVWLARHQARATRQTKRSINIIMYTVLLASIYGLLLNVLIPVFFSTQAYDIFGILVVDIFAIGLAHSVINAKLLDVKLYVIRSLGYLLAVATLLLVYGILAVIASQTVLDTTYTSAQQVFNILMVLVLALVFQPIRQFFDRITSRIFFREDYDSSVFFEKLNRILGGTQDMRRLLERVADYVSQTLRAKRAVFFLYQADKAPLVVSVPVKSVFARQDAKILDDYF
ncbi:hypothetical protein B7Z17_03090, partial [Candidatus Saccharibacteria bacterium 32-49-10]